jgi:energy-coupling factor transporter ATP-binding protein EcfA2
VTAPRQSSAPDPAAAARALVGELGQVASIAGRADLRERLERELARWGAAGTTIVVAGETGSGKSTLVNAMLGQPELLPVAGEGASTAVPVVVRHGPQLGVRIHALGGAPTDASLDAARDWISQAGNPGNRRGVQAVEIALPHSLLARGLVLVDTPGIPTGSASDGDSTLATLSWADALLFVTSARAPMSAHEVGFLRQAMERVETVIIVLSKTDAYPGWRDVQEQDRTTLESLALSSAPVPISSRLRHLAERTRRDGDAAFAQELVADSGFPELAAALEERVIGHAAGLRLTNLLRLCETLVDRLELADRATLAAGEDDPAALAALQDANARLADVGKATTAASSRVYDAFELARLDLTQQLTNRLGELQRTGEARAATVGSDADLQVLADELSAGLADVARQLAGAFASRVAYVLSDLERTYDAALAGPAETQVATTEVRLAEPVSPALRGAYGTVRSHYYPFLMGSGIVGTLGATVTALAGVTIAWPIAIASLAIGGISVVLSRRVADRDALRQRARETVRTVVGDARSELQGWLTRVVLETRRALQDGIRQALEEQGEELRRAAEAEQRTLKSDRAARKRQRDAASARLEQLRSIRARCEALRLAVTRAPRPG